VNWVIGIDEAGRGALAGPVCVGAVLYPDDLDWKEAFSLVTKRGKPKLRDSKQLTAQQRDILFEYITEHGRLRHASAFIDARTIDEIGIVNAGNEAAAVAIASLDIRPSRVSVLLDAGLRAPKRWQQESFIRGDERIPAIAFASIIAKVTRDRLMEDLAETHAAYRFDEHKGYATADHRRRIRKEGVCELHRVTFCTRIFDILPIAA
jgi:ribonuclease HII